MLRVIYLSILVFWGGISFAQSGKRSDKKVTTDTTRALDPVGDLYRSSLKLIDSLRFKEAIKVLEKVVKKWKNYAEAYNKMAYCYIQQKDYANAQKNLELSVKYQPDNYECIKLLGRVCYLNKNYDCAKREYDDAMKMEPTDLELQLYVAELRALGQDIKGAIESYNGIIQEKDNYAQAYINRGALKFKLKQYPYAIKDMEQGLILSKYKDVDDEIYNDIAEAKFELGDYKGAIKVYDTLINRNKKNEWALTYRGAAKLNNNDFSAAINDLSEAIKLNPKSYVAYNFRGAAKGGLKQYLEALKDLEISIKLKFDYPSVYVNRASIRMASKDRKGACEDLHRADQLGSNMAYKLIQQYCGGPDY